VQTYLADAAFDVVERPIALRADNNQYREVEVETKPQRTWTAVSDARRGLAIISRGLLETAVRDLPERPLALTLMRGTRRTIFTTGEPGGQEKGCLTFDYWLLPLAGAPDVVHLCELGQRLASGLQTAQMRPQDVEIYKTECALPPTASFLRLSGPVVMSSVRRVGEGLEVRLFNPTAASASATLDVTGAIPTGSTDGASQITWVQTVDMESRPREEPRAVAGPIDVLLPPKKIMTLRLW